VELKNISDVLNLETMNLNKAVEQTRIMHSFLLERKRKLDALKEYLQQISIKNNINNKMKKLKYDSNKKSAVHNEKVISVAFYFLCGYFHLLMPYWLFYVSHVEDRFFNTLRL
jgi:hypothetical protein